MAKSAGWKAANSGDLLRDIDETWQQELWGEDEEAVAAAETKRLAFLDAVRFLALARAA